MSKLLDAYQRRRNAQKAAMILEGTWISSSVLRSKLTRRYMETSWGGEPYYVGPSGLLKKAWLREGMRVVGNVIPDLKPRDYIWWHPGTSDKPTGWYDNPHGESTAKGEGLVWGVVYQMPVKRRLTRLVVGYEFGSGWGGPIFDRTVSFEGIVPRSESIRECDFAIEAARWADQLAQDAADKERDYQEEMEEGFEEA